MEPFRYSSSATLGSTLSSCSRFKRSYALLDISESVAEADSTSINELPCSYGGGGGIGSKMSEYFGPQEATSNTDHHSSKSFSFDTAMDFGFVDTRADGQDEMEPAFLLPILSKPSSGQSPNLRQSLCPAIHTNMQFRDHSDSIQHRELLFTRTPQLSSPDTATTDTSGDSFPSDSGYCSVTPDPYYTSTTSPGSFYLQDEESEFDDTYFWGAGNLVGVPEFPRGRYLDQSYCPQPIPANDSIQKELLDISTARHAIYCSCQIQGTQALCFLEHGESGFEPNDARVGGSYADARMAQYMIDVDIDPLCHSFYIEEEPQSLRPALLRGGKCLDTIIPKADTFTKGGAATLIPGQDTKIQYNSDLFLYCASAPPWSVEHTRGFDLPDSQLQIRERAATPVHDTPSPKSESKSFKCDYKDCTYEPSGEYQWRKGNLARHKRETHEMKSENRFICNMNDCKETFTRISNLNVHQENKHDLLIFRKRRNRRSSVAGNINKPKTGRRITKAPKMVALTNRPEHNRSQPVPGPFDHFAA
ncbi:hypothetical protein OCU04_004620 [Sclerotinia nivalis]|uniref:C2H2-type domain-containing protein n=1 Tax=Sclerotinia nivalis TaxID=352851 RepID=A0A9X0AU62_9HELO|nr:hypothetical protein OCU04_004620 [Sclerotinia nivalis]